MPVPVHELATTEAFLPSSTATRRSSRRRAVLLLQRRFRRARAPRRTSHWRGVPRPGAPARARPRRDGRLRLPALRRAAGRRRSATSSSTAASAPTFPPPRARAPVTAGYTTLARRFALSGGVLRRAGWCRPSWVAEMAPPRSDDPWRSGYGWPSGSPTSVARPAGGLRRPASPSAAGTTRPRHSPTPSSPTGRPTVRGPLARALTANDCRAEQVEWLLGLGLELVADAEARLDERVPRRAAGRSSAAAGGRRRRRCGRGASRAGPTPSAAARPGDDAAVLPQRGCRAAWTRSVQRRRSCRRRTPAPPAGRCAAFDLDRLAAPLFGRPHTAPGGGADARDELAHRDGFTRSRRRRSRGRARGRARPRAPRRRRSACRSPRRGPSRSASSRRAPGSIRSRTQTSGFSKRSRASPSSPRPTTIGSNRPRRGAGPSRPRSRCRPRRSGSWPRPYDRPELVFVRVSEW